MERVATAVEVEPGGSIAPGADVLLQQVQDLNDLPVTASKENLDSVATVFPLDQRGRQGRERIAEAFRRSRLTAWITRDSICLLLQTNGPAITREDRRLVIESRQRPS